jgi:hypothetical protein
MVSAEPLTIPRPTLLQTCETQSQAVQKCGRENSYLYEMTFNFAERNYLCSRLELVDKDELDLAPPLDKQVFRIGSDPFGRGHEMTF